jgi:hypothetical protein
MYENILAMNTEDFRQIAQYISLGVKRYDGD